MAKPKAQTLQQRFGFMDDDLKSPDHDQIMIWLDGNVREIARKIIGWSDSWDPGKVEKLQARALEAVENYNQIAGAAWQVHFDGLGDPPPKPPLEIAVDWEKAVTSEKQRGNKYVIGFIDMSVMAFPHKLDVLNIDKDRFNPKILGKWRLDDGRNLPKWYSSYTEHTINFEVKSKIPSLGELIRQIRMYQEYQLGRYFVVSPDDQFAEQLSGQGIGFIKYPTAEVYKR